MEKIGGIVFVKVDGEQLRVKGNVTYNLGLPLREPVVGHDGVHGFKEVPQVAFIELEMTDKKDLSLKKFLSITSATVTAQLNNGKTIVLRNAANVSEGTGNSEEANMTVRFVGSDAEEIIP